MTGWLTFAIIIASIIALVMAAPVLLVLCAFISGITQL